MRFNSLHIKLRELMFLLCFLFGMCQYCQSRNKIVISKQNLELYVITEHKDTIFKTPIAVGLNLGDKKKEGDMRTPEGVFYIRSIERSSRWTHDFKDGHGQRKGAYGPYFIRLKIPNVKGIGIHGTCFPSSIGTRCSEGCVRVKNEKLLELVKYVFVGMQVVIEPDI